MVPALREGILGGAAGSGGAKMALRLSAGELYMRVLVRNAIRAADQHATAARRMAWRTERHKRAPAWRDREAIAAFYAEARRLTAETGVHHAVDHILPLRGKLVCGLHVEFNLQILTRLANSQKGNRFPI